MAQVYLISGASTGFGALIARALAKQGHTVFAGMYSHDGKTQVYEEDLKNFAQDNKVDLRGVHLDLLSQESVNTATTHVIDSCGKIDAVIHNAGHMNWGPSESFTPEQFLRMYDVNVVGCQRLNQAVLPHMRKARSGHVIWIASSSTYGGKSAMLGPYFAAKAAQDSLAQTYATELVPWGIETTIVTPGVFTSGTNHFLDAAHPGLPHVAEEYELGPTKGLAELTMEGTKVIPPSDADPSVVADTLVQLAAFPRGQKPFRMFADPGMDGAEAAAAVVDSNKVNFYRRGGWMDYLKVWL